VLKGARNMEGKVRGVNGGEGKIVEMRRMGRK
jgi:hypothetical protein